ncbi:MAG: hypothetical protein EOS25_31050 [Mesorhizobium sp.]|uniref:hypothetical protein n=1 Tax=Mesorhizobium sp. TaxID=1871066 RepID=UPI000FE6A871|nr:hypothetical protein [Mesorhizobium sp.]RWE56022.1 MAG: hypothetical protein EOS24_22095 [Mesorhizobium sp.]RWF11032.1 MAG: hypothetical protein EOS69_11960 [Mesorhizobium sp.]RWF12062.1 MAG: hypothetical protein EOS25_31050 [Mesorhizobium sp.]
MSNRYATIIIDDDGREVVSAIGQFEGVPDARRGRVEPVADGVRIGMVRGGSVDAVGGFGFAVGAPGIDAGALGMVRARLKQVSQPAAEATEGATGAARAPRAKPRKKPRKARRAARPAASKAAKSDTAGGAAAEIGPAEPVGAAAND